MSDILTELSPTMLPRSALCWGFEAAGWLVAGRSPARLVLLAACPASRTVNKFNARPETGSLYMSLQAISVTTTASHLFFSPSCPCWSQSGAPHTSHLTPHTYSPHLLMKRTIYWLLCSHKTRKTVRCHQLCRLCQHGEEVEDGVMVSAHNGSQKVIQVIRSRQWQDLILVDFLSSH